MYTIGPWYRRANLRIFVQDTSHAGTSKDRPAYLPLQLTLVQRTQSGKVDAKTRAGVYQSGRQPVAISIAKNCGSAAVEQLCQRQTNPSHHRCAHEGANIGAGHATDSDVCHSGRTGNVSLQKSPVGFGDQRSRPAVCELDADIRERRGIQHHHIAKAVEAHVGQVAIEIGLATTYLICNRCTYFEQVHTPVSKYDK